MGMTLLLAYGLFVGVALLAVTATDLLEPHWDSLYDRRSTYESWRDKWQERRSMRRESKSGSSISTFSAWRKRMQERILHPKLFPTRS